MGENHERSRSPRLLFSGDRGWTHIILTLVPYVFRALARKAKVTHVLRSLRRPDDLGANSALRKVSRIQCDDECRIACFCASAERVVRWIGRYTWILTNLNQNALLAYQIDECADSGGTNPEPLQHFLVFVEDVLRVKPLEMTIFNPLEKESAAIGFWT